MSEAEDILIQRIITADPMLSGYLAGAFMEKLKGAAEEETQASVSTDAINQKLTELIRDMSMNLDLSECENDEEKALKSIDAIRRNVNVGKDIRALEETVKNLKEIYSVSTEPKEKDNINVDTDTVLFMSKSIEEITRKVPEYEFQPEKEQMVCIVCGASFQKQKFFNLKNSLRKHLEAPSHIKKIMDDKVAQLTWAKEDGRNRAVGMRVGRLVYYLVYHGRPDIDLPVLVYASVANGLDMGDINHGRGFVTRLLPYLAGAVRRRMKEMLGTRMVATGTLPPVNLCFDKATHQRETRHLVGCLTLNPGGKEPIVALLLGLPKCAGGTGPILTNSITEVADEYIVPEQYVGGTGDGVYEHCGVGALLDRHYDRKGFFTWDLMHLAATIDALLRNLKKPHSAQFKWLNLMTEIIRKSVTFVQWGMEWTRFFEVIKIVHLILYFY